MDEEYDYGIIGSVNDTTVIKIKLSKFRDKYYIHIREYMYNPDDNCVYPTKKGYVFNPSLVDNLIEKLELVSNTFTDINRINSNQLELFKDGK